MCVAKEEADATTISEGSFGQGPFYTCQCKENYIPDSTDDYDGTYCVMGDTAAPSLQPTHQPTNQACTNGAHFCDTKTTMCVAGEGKHDYECECLEGYIRIAEHSWPSRLDSMRRRRFTFILS